LSQLRASLRPTRRKNRYQCRMPCTNPSKFLARIWCTGFFAISRSPAVKKPGHQTLANTGSLADKCRWSRHSPLHHFKECCDPLWHNSCWIRVGRNDAPSPGPALRVRAHRSACQCASTALTGGASLRERAWSYSIFPNALVQAALARARPS
jgi:hypothetical protein